MVETSIQKKDERVRDPCLRIAALLDSDYNNCGSILLEVVRFLLRRL